MIVKNANVLGAGDMFAAGVLYSLYYMNLTEEDAIQNACIFTSNMIRKYNEKV
jgi:sugar/nucleoside kinase (ribokinase family)